MPEIEIRQFFWIPIDRTTKYSIKIGTTDITDNVISSSFSMGLLGQELGCELVLDNNSEIYTNAFNAGDDIFLYLDFADGTTVQFKGILEKPRDQLNSNGFIINIKGSHLSSVTLDITVTAEFTNSEISAILKNIIDNNLTGFTYNNVQTTTITTNKKWEKKPFLDCVLDLMKLDYDCYIDNSKDFHLFPKGSIENQNDAIVFRDSLIELRGLGIDSVDVKNKIIVQGEAGELPVLYTSQDTPSQTTYGIKEKNVSDTSIVNEAQAKNVGDAEANLLKNPPTKGEADTYIMSQINPGDKIWISSPPHKIQDTYRLVKYTFRIPEFTMTHYFNEEISIAKLFKERIDKDRSQEKLTNPFKMLYSYNFIFDDQSNINELTNCKIEDSFLKLAAGASSGRMISSEKITPITVSKVHLQVKGEDISNAAYWISADVTDNYQQINIDTETMVENKGNRLKLKIIINANTCRLDSVALLYK